MPLTLKLEDADTASGQDGLSVRLDGPEPELDQVESVTYLLQSLVPNPLRFVRDRTGGFRTCGISRHVLGVQARIRRRDGSEEVLEH